MLSTIIKTDFPVRREKTVTPNLPSFSYFYLIIFFFEKYN